MAAGALSLLMTLLLMENSWIGQPQAARWTQAGYRLACLLSSRDGRRYAFGIRDDASR